MRGKVARRIRSEVYGADFSPSVGARTYGRHQDTGSIHAHTLRQNYQQAKRAHTRGPSV